MISLCFAAAIVHYREHLFPFIAFLCAVSDVILFIYDLCNIYIACFVPITLLLTITAITRRVAKAI